jgi:hypothetical protein
MRAVAAAVGHERKQVGRTITVEVSADDLHRHRRECHVGDSRRSGKHTVAVIK